MKDMLRTFVAEFIGTFALTFVGGAAIMNARGTDGAAGLTAVALAHGLILALMVSAFMRVSAAFNPAVSVALVATRKIAPTTFLVHLVAQLAGAVLAAHALHGSFPADVVLATRVGGQSVSAAVTTWQAFSLEAIATAFLVFVMFGTAVDPKGPEDRRLGDRTHRCRRHSRHRPAHRRLDEPGPVVRSGARLGNLRGTPALLGGADSGGARGGIHVRPAFPARLRVRRGVASGRSQAAAHVRRRVH